MNEKSKKEIEKINGIEIHCKYDQLLELKNINEHPNNENDHPKEQIEALAKIIIKDGFRHPIVISNLSGYVNQGHGRKLAAELIGLEKAPVVYQNFEDQEQEFRVRVSDNKISGYAEFNVEKFNINLEEHELSIDDLELNEWGIVEFETKEKEIESVDLGEDDVDDDEKSKIEITDLGKEPSYVQRGDIWLLGNHRIMCGDSTNELDVERLMDNKIAVVAFTSPPYNGDTHLDYGKGENKKLYENNTDKWNDDEYLKFCQSALRNIFRSVNGFIFWNVMYNNKSRFQFLKCIEPYFEKLWESIVWKKTGMPLSNGLTRNFEFIFCFKNGERKHLSEEFKTEYNLWEISNIGAQDKSNHRACFPVALPSKGITISSKDGDIVLDLFLGSGSTLIACEKTKRKCYGIELDEHYCKVIIERYMKYAERDDVYLLGQNNEKIHITEIVDQRKKEYSEQ